MGIACNLRFVGHEVLPGWVGGANKGELLGSGPVLEFLLAGYGVVDVLKLFEVDEAGDVVSRGEAPRSLLTVFHDPAAEVVGDADVDGSGTAGEDVDPELIVVLGLHTCLVTVVW